MNNLTEIVFILDRSGSMGGMERDTIGGYNSFLEKQKSGDGDAFVTTILFSNYSEFLHDRVPIKEVNPLTENDYSVGGCTALLDTIGHAVKHIEQVHKYIKEEDVPDKTIFVITTDGLENASREYSSDQVKQLITKMKEEKGWEFLFVAEDLHATETAARMGISHDRVAFYVAHEDTTSMYDVMADQVKKFRLCEKIDPDWADKVRRPRQPKSPQNDDDTQSTDNN